MGVTAYPFPYLSDVAGTGVSAVRGEGGFTVIHKGGRNADVDTPYEALAPGGIFRTPTSTVSLEFISSDTADALDDTGMHELTVEGLDGSWNEQTVTTAAHATDGTTAVSISGSWLRVNRVYVSKSGNYADISTGSHVGDITLRVASAGATWATIPSNDYARGESEIGCHSVPTGKTAYIPSLVVDADAGQNTNPNVLLMVRENADDTSSSYDGVMLQKWNSVGIQGEVVIRPATPFGPFVGPCDIMVMALGAATTATVESDLEIILLDT